MQFYRQQKEMILKLKLPLVAGLVLLCVLAIAIAIPSTVPSMGGKTPESTDGTIAASSARGERVAAVTASLSQLAQSPVQALRPTREGEEDSRIESAYSEDEILELIEQAHQMPADPDVHRLGEGPSGGVGFTAGTSFDSIDISECCGSGTLNPPDPEIAVGQDHIVAAVNASLEIYDKSGTSLLGPLSLETFFQSLGLGCTIFAFDPNAIYDENADRYIIGADGNGTEYCVAVSQTGDATGMYNFYAFPVNVGGDFFDYPHIGVGVDAIYVGSNMFGGGEGRIFAFEKAAMYAGTPAASATQFLGFDNTPQPMKIHGPEPAESKHYFVTSRSGSGVFQLYSWDDPFGTDTLVDEGSLDLPASHGVTVGFGVGSPQLGGGSINSIGPRALDFEYRDGFGYLTNLVSCNPGGGTVNCVQWGQIDVATATVAQAGVFGTDGDYRIFPDLAVNACGDMMVGYTKLTSSSLPSVWMAGRQASDPPGTMQGEIEIKAGEVAFGSSRWGDYTGMTIDPDGTTFWYLGEYSKDIPTQPSWGTFVGSASFDDCTPNGLFADGFEAGDTSGWSNTSP